MIQQHFTEPTHWERWLALTEAWPDAEDELSARALLLHRRFVREPELGDPVLRACERADVAS